MKTVAAISVSQFERDFLSDRPVKKIIGDIRYKIDMNKGLKVMTFEESELSMDEWKDAFSKMNFNGEAMYFADNVETGERFMDMVYNGGNRFREQSIKEVSK